MARRQGGGGVGEYVTTAEIAKALRLTPGRIRQKVRAGEIPGSVLVAGRRLFKREAVVHLLEGRKPRRRRPTSSD